MAITRVGIYQSMDSTSKSIPGIAQCGTNDDPSAQANEGLREGI